MLESPGPVIVDMVVSKEENCFPMIPGGAAHNEMLLGVDEVGQASRIGFGVAATVQQLLPLANHAQPFIVYDEYLHRQIVLGDGSPMARVARNPVMP